MGFPRPNAARPTIRRALIALIAGAIAFPVAMLPAMPAAATSPSWLVSKSQWTETLGTTQAVHMVGQIQNLSGGAVASVQVNIEWRDSFNVVVGHSSTTATKKVLANLDYSPFEDLEFPAATLNYDHFEVASITYSPSIATPYHLDASSDPCPPGSPSDEVCGTVTNNGALTVEDVTAILTYTDALKTVGQDAWAVDNDNGGTSFAHGDQGHFKFFRIDGHSPVSITAAAEPAYLVDVNPPSLDIGPVNVGKSGQQNISVTNNGSLPLHVTNVQALPTPEFAASTDCPSGGLAPGLGCHVTVHITPAASGPRSGTLTITDDAAGSQQTVLLTATGSAPAVAFDPPTLLAFGTALRAGMPGVLKTVTLTNTGDGPLTITSVNTDDAINFSAYAGACPIAPYSLPPLAQCPIDVTFAPVIAGPYSANLVVADDAGTQRLPLTALATGPGAQFRLGGTPISTLDFGQVTLNAPGSPLTITLANNGTEPLLVNSIATTGDFRQTTTCGATLAAGASCVFIVVFTPSQLGARSGALTISDNAANLQQSVSFTGSGVSGVPAGRRLSSGVHRGTLRDATVVRRRR